MDSDDNGESHPPSQMEMDLSSKGIPKSVDDDTSNQNTNNDTTQNQVENVTTPHSENLLDAVEFAGGLIFGVFGFVLGESGFHLIGRICDCLAISCGIILVVHRLKKWGLKYASYLCIGLLITNFAAFVFLSFRYIAAEKLDTKPVISQSQVDLGNGSYGIQNSLTIFNPSIFPIFDLTLEIKIKGDGVRADSIDLKMTDENILSGNVAADDKDIYGDAYTMRCDYLGNITNQYIAYVIGNTPPHGYRYLQISGTLAKKSTAQISIVDYNTNAPEVFKNGITNMFHSKAMKMTAYVLTVSNSSGKFPVMNIPTPKIENNGRWRHYRFENY